MRLLTILLALIIGIVFFIQNQQAVTLVFFGNLASLALPISGWVLLFVMAGAITSLLWRVILPSQKPSASRFEAERSRPYTPPPSPPRTPIAPDLRPPQDYTRSSVDTPLSSSKTDWERTPPKEEWDDWEVEQPVSEPSAKPASETTSEPSQTFEDSNRFERKLEENNAPAFEVEQQPKIATRTGSVYSYVYRESKDKQDKEKEPNKVENEERKSDRVYDANYRVIRPSYQENVEVQPRQDEQDEEDWI